MERSREDRAVQAEAAAERNSQTAGDGSSRGSRFTAGPPHPAVLPSRNDSAMTDRQPAAPGQHVRKTSLDRMLETTFLATVAGASILFGFGMTIAVAKKKDPTMFAKGLMGQSGEVAESGGRLAMRALGWGTLYSVTGFSVFCYAVWKLMGVQNLQEFRAKAGSLLPRIPRNEPQGRTEFESLRDLMTFLSEEGKK